MDQRRKNNWQGVGPLARAGEVSRRVMVAGTMATTTIAVLPLATAAYAQGTDTDMMAFVLLSEALTGVHRQTLAPELTEKAGDILGSDAGVDPINIKNEYFDWIKGHDPTSSFGKLLQIAKDNPQSSQIVDKVNGSADDMKFLARSIVLLWYLGAWYKPDDLKNNVGRPQVISPKAYTQGLVWQIAGAHPMGYSNLQFGYWSRDPRDPSAPALFNPPKP